MRSYTDAELMDAAVRALRRFRARQQAQHRCAMPSCRKVGTQYVDPRWLCPAHADWMRATLANIAARKEGREVIS